MILRKPADFILGLSDSTVFPRVHGGLPLVLFPVGFLRFRTEELYSFCLEHMSNHHGVNENIALAK